MITGLYALASLDGAPLNEEDLAKLGLGPGPATHQAPGLRLRIEDCELGGRAVSIAMEAGTVLALLGHLDEPDELAQALNMRHAAAQAELALQALRRWGPQAIAQMPGEWSLLCWNSDRRDLILGVSTQLRDPICFASDGRRVAVAPQPMTLSRLASVGRDWDREGLALTFSQVAPRRRLLREQTILKRVKRLDAGTMRRFSPAGETCTQAPSLTPDSDWSGSFDEAVAALEKIARRIMHQTLARHETVAIMLSGGLDSSTLAWLASEERRSGQKLVCITSAAAEGSDLRDERSYSRIVADHLGLPVVFVTPPPEDNPYRPSARCFAHYQAPSLSSRHYLYDRLFEAGADQGADAIIDGVWGETGLTRKVIFREFRAAWPEYKYWLRNLYQERVRLGEAWPQTAFAARLSEDALQNMPAALLDERPPMEWPLLYRRDQRLGLADQAVYLAARTRTAQAHTGLRRLFPYRHEPLMRLAAGMPAGFTHRGGYSRAMVRSLLKDRLPDSIRLRTNPVPFSPDYVRRLRNHAPSVLERLAVFRNAGADEWLDLDWLAKRVTRLAAGENISIREQSKIQITAMTAEFFVWWQQTAQTE
ncbi:asparagine synthetase B (glutamine-hydrolysing) [Rhizomicrobium palustre]|uniref:asparagine synthase (glutamine-hydrolyzing) n=1 Tax=Rhizomicrobium palustre TaxID=189966 RepID=A0A846N1D2_9PROT|nr:asparagine synthetase B family protein [Rhizomicrobium palustre]NIK88967.1 asparagine synthetase B (glutamine-hydrolysing) [Rhizomicrobium palustre]